MWFFKDGSLRSPVSSERRQAELPAYHRAIELSPSQAWQNSG
jgi:hypothetical protein